MRFTSERSDRLSLYNCAQVTVNFLVELDKLTQLLESPIFTHLRLQLLEPQRYAYLVKALYGLLMLLPQACTCTRVMPYFMCGRRLPTTR